MGKCKYLSFFKILLTICRVKFIKICHFFKHIINPKLLLIFVGAFVLLNVVLVYHTMQEKKQFVSSRNDCNPLRSGGYKVGPGCAIPNAVLFVRR